MLRVKKPKFQQNTESTCGKFHVVFPEGSHFKTLLMSIFLLPANCRSPLGMESATILINGSMVSSALGEDVTTKGIQRSKLLLEEGRSQSGSPFGGNNIWILANLQNESIVTGISTQGYSDADNKEWITEYILMYSTGTEYLYFRNTSGEIKVTQYEFIVV